MTKKTRIDIAACTDRNFVMPTGVMMQSVCVNNPDVDIVFHIIVDGDVTDDDKRDLRDITVPFEGKSIVFYLASEYVKKINFPALENRFGLTKTTYYRLWLAEIIPNDIDKILYLDGDVIVRHSLLPLWNTDLEGNAVGAVANEDVELFVRLKISRELGYFNAGVLLIDLKYWRENHVTKEFLEYISLHSTEIVFHDQDVLNVVFREKKKWLPIEYNFAHYFLKKHVGSDFWKYEEEVRKVMRDPTIVHFTNNTIGKPWNKYQRNPHPFRSSFYKYQNQTRWKGVIYENRPITLRIINYVSDMLRKTGVLPKVTRYDLIEIDPID